MYGETFSKIDGPDVSVSDCPVMPTKGVSPRVEIVSIFENGHVSEHRRARTQFFHGISALNAQVVHDGPGDPRTFRL